MQRRRSAAPCSVSDKTFEQRRCPNMSHADVNPHFGVVRIVFDALQHPLLRLVERRLRVCVLCNPKKESLERRKELRPHQAVRCNEAKTIGICDDVGMGVHPAHSARHSRDGAVQRALKLFSCSARLEKLDERLMPPSALRQATEEAFRCADIRFLALLFRLLRRSSKRRVVKVNDCCARCRAWRYDHVTFMKVTMPKASSVNRAEGSADVTSNTAEKHVLNCVAVWVAAVLVQPVKNALEGPAVDKPSDDDAARRRTGGLDRERIRDQLVFQGRGDVPITLRTRRIRGTFVDLHANVDLAPEVMGSVRDAALTTSNSDALSEARGIGVEKSRRHARCVCLVLGSCRRSH